MYKITPFRWISQFYFGFFFVYGVYLPFWGIWLKSEGFSDEKVGIIIGVAFAARCLSNFLITPRIQRFEWLLPALRYLTLASVVFLLLHGVSASNYPLILLVTIGFNCCIGPSIPLSDLVSNYYARKGLFDYGKARLWGSFSFIVASTIVGWLVTHSSADTILIAAIVSMFILFLLSLRKPSPEPEPYRTDSTEKFSITKALTDRATLKFLLLVSCLQGSHAAYYGFSSIYWKSVGYTEDTIGYLWSLGVVAEVIVFAVSQRVFSRWSIRWLFLLSSGAVMIRWGLTASTAALPCLVIIQLLHSLTFAVAHLAAIRYIQKVPENQMVTLQSLYNALALGAMMAIMTPVCGWGYSHFGAHVFWGMALMGLIALCFRVDHPIIKTHSAA